MITRLCVREVWRGGDGIFHSGFPCYSGGQWDHLEVGGSHRKEGSLFSLRLSVFSVWGLELGVTSLLGRLKCHEEKFLEPVVCEWVATSASRVWFLCSA